MQPRPLFFRIRLIFAYERPFCCFCTGNLSVYASNPRPRRKTAFSGGRAVGKDDNNMQIWGAPPPSGTLGAAVGQAGGGPKNSIAKK